MKLGLAVGLAAGAGGVGLLGVAAVVAVAVWRGPAASRAGVGAAREATGASVATGATVATNPAAAPVPGTPAPAPAAEALAVRLSADTLYTRTAPAVVRIEVRDEKFKGLSRGTGFFVSADGLLVTNHHVIEGGSFVTVETADGVTLFVEGVAAVDAKQDLALLKVRASGVKCLELAPDERPPIGTRVFAIGHPRGVKHSVLSEGLVSSVGEAIGDVASIATTAPVSPGSSGGPLVGADGAVVGVIAAGREDAQNMNFAVPAALVRKLVRSGSGATLKTLASAGGGALSREQAAVLRKAWAAIDNGDLRGAASVLSEARPRLRESNAYWVTVGVLHTQLKNYAVASEAYQNAVRVKPDDVASHAMLGVTFFFQEKYREAIKSCEAGARLAPRDPRFPAAAGDCHRLLGQPDRAVAFYKKALQLAPSDAAYTRNLGDCYFAMKQYADALMTYEKALKLNAADAEALTSVGQCELNLKRYDASAASLRKALALDPKNARAHLLSGLVHLERNQPAAALAAFQTAARLDPGGKIGQDANAAAGMLQAELDRERAQREAQQRQQQMLPPHPGHPQRVSPYRPR